MVKYIKIYILVKNMKEVKIYTDGACSGNPGKGGWAAILVYGNNEKSLSAAVKKQQITEWNYLRL